jgi:undecaprenyl-diphosphatase
MAWIKTGVLAIIQGLTEFLPVSSDGHLAIGTHLFNRYAHSTESLTDDFFYIVALHVGTLAAIVAYHRRAAIDGAAGLLLDSKAVPPAFQRWSVFRAGMLAFVAMLPALPVGLFLKDSIEALFGSTRAAAIGFLITAAELLVVARLPDGKKTLRETTWLDALLIGVGQTFAVLPGVSRSGTTIAIALSLGFSRAWAVGFSLLIAVPAILGGAVLELKDAEFDSITMDRWIQIVLGMILAGIVGYGAIVWLTRVVAKGRLWHFSVYLIVIAVAVLLGLGDGRNQVGREKTDGANPPQSYAP